jgi:hypothetical protein
VLRDRHRVAVLEVQVCIRTDMGLTLGRYRYAAGQTWGCCTGGTGLLQDRHGVAVLEVQGCCKTNMACSDSKAHTAGQARRCCKESKGMLQVGHQLPQGGFMNVTGTNAGHLQAFANKKGHSPKQNC